MHSRQTRWMAVVLGLTLVLSLDLSAQGPFSAQIQRALASLANGTSKFTTIGFTLGSQLIEEALDVLAMRRTTNGQALRIYNTYTDASNYERANLGWSANVFNVTVGAAGSGNSRSLTIGTDGTSSGFLNMMTAGTIRWQMPGTGANTGHLLAIGADNTYDIGASGATRPRTGYFGTSVIVPAVNATTSLQLNGNIALTATAPTISGFAGSSPAATVTAGSTTAAFRIGVGGTAPGTTGTILLPTATTGWNCWVIDQTTPLDITRQTASTTAQISITSTIAWTANDILIGGCTAF